MLAKSNASQRAHSAKTSPSTVTTSPPDKAVAHLGGTGTSSVGVAGPNGAEGVPNLPSLYSTTTTAQYSTPSCKGWPSIVETSVCSLECKLTEASGERGCKSTAVG